MRCGRPAGTPWRDDTAKRGGGGMRRGKRAAAAVETDAPAPAPDRTSARAVAPLRVVRLSVSEAAPVLVGARRVGAPLRRCAQAAGVPWTTLMDWLRRGREALAGDVVSEADRPYAALAAELDRCGAELELLLRERVVEHTRDDGRLALDTLRWIEGERDRRLARGIERARLRKLGADATLAEAASKAIGAAESITLTLPASVSTPRTDGDDT